MSSCQSSGLPHLQLSKEQEREVRDWVSDERSAGFVVRKELIHWFAQRVIQRDGVQHDGVQHDLDAGFTDSFLSRNPDLAKRILVLPPQPRHDSPKVEKPAAPLPLRGRALMQERIRQDKIMSLYGDNPPPPRQPEPYPEGEIIYHFNCRYVVRHGDTITKYTTFPQGMGAKDHPNEAAVLRFVKENTTIPVPTIISSDWDRITMEYVEGQTLKQAWPVLTPDQRTNILDQLKGYIAQMRALSGTYIGRFDGQGVIVPCIMMRSGGPFSNNREFHDWLVKPPSRLERQSMYWHQITTQLGTEYPIVFTHGDISSRNILVRDGRIVALLDWEFAGWCPEYWEYALTLRGLDNVDWETIGCHIPSLFAKRYDLEYMLVRFILTLN